MKLQEDLRKYNMSLQIFDEKDYAIMRYSKHQEDLKKAEKELKIMSYDLTFCVNSGTD